MRFLFKLCASIYLVIVFTVISLFTLIFFRDNKKRLERISRNTALFSPILLKIMDVKFKVIDHTRGKALADRSLMVANHVSYVDVFILAAIRPMLFISSVELAGKPFVGHISKLGGTVFVERRKYKNLRQEIGSIATVLDQGFTMVLFPEAGTSDGKALLPFRPSLFEAAVQSGVDVVPVCVKYLKIDGQPLSMQNKDYVVFHGGIRFIPHILRLFTHHGIEAEVNIFSRIPSTGKKRKELVRLTYRQIEECHGRLKD